MFREIRQKGNQELRGKGVKWQGEREGGVGGWGSQEMTVDGVQLLAWENPRRRKKTSDLEVGKGPGWGQSKKRSASKLGRSWTLLAQKGALG